MAASFQASFATYAGLILIFALIAIAMVAYLASDVFLGQSANLPANKGVQLKNDILKLDAVAGAALLGVDGDLPRNPANGALKNWEHGSLLTMNANGQFERHSPTDNQVRLVVGTEQNLTWVNNPHLLVLNAEGREVATGFYQALSPASVSLVVWSEGVLVDEPLVQTLRVTVVQKVVTFAGTQFESSGTFSVSQSQFIPKGWVMADTQDPELARSAVAVAGNSSHALYPLQNIPTNISVDGALGLVTASSLMPTVAGSNSTITCMFVVDVTVQPDPVSLLALDSWRFRSR